MKAMPRGDGTGPAGMGPRTGRGLGPCTGYPAAGWTNVARAGWSGICGLLGLGRRAAGAMPRLGRGTGLGRDSGKGLGRGF